MQATILKAWLSVILITLVSFQSHGQDRRLYGVSSQWWYIHNWTDPQDTNRLNKFISEYKALGINVVRLGLDWQVIEPKHGQRQYGEYKKMVDALVANGIEVILLFYTAPKYMVKKESHYQSKCCPATNKWCVYSELRRDSVKAFNKMVKDAANHFSNVRYWEFWNEPQYDGAMGQPVEFAFWFTKFIRKVKSQNPQAKVSMGTIYAQDYQNYITEDFVRNVHNHLAVEDYPDAISLHPYQRFVGDTSPSIAHINKALVRSVHNMYPSTKIWITEYGWDMQHGFTDEQQAQGIKNALTWMESRDYIQFATFHMLHDWNGWNDCDNTTVKQRMGLVNKAFLNVEKDYKRKLAWCAFYEKATGNVATCPIKVEINGIVGFQDDDDPAESSLHQLDMRYYPNPAKQTLNIDFHGSGSIVAMAVEDLNGNKYEPPFRQVVSGLIIDVGTLPKGIYVVKIQTSEKSVVKRFVKE